MRATPGQVASLEAERPGRPLDLALGLLAATLFMALLTAAEGAIYRQARGDPIQWGSLVGLRLLDWGTCALFAPPLYWLITRLPRDGRFWRISLPALVAATVLAAALKYVVHTPLAAWLDPERARSIGEALRADFLAKVMFFWAVAGLLYAVALQRGDGVFARVVAATPPGPPLTAAPVRTLRLPDSSGTVVLTAGDVDWIEAQGNYCRVHAGARRPLVRRTLSSLLEELGPGFLRVHRSRAVNLERVQRVESRGGRVRLVLADGAAIEGGRAYQAEVRRRLGRSSPQA